MRRTVLHANWEFAQRTWDTTNIGYSKMPWQPATVPGHVHLDLQQQGIIPDPHELMYEASVQWVDQADWSYKTTFEWSPAEGTNRRILHFAGLDAHAQDGPVGAVLVDGHAARFADDLRNGGAHLLAIDLGRGVDVDEHAADDEGLTPAVAVRIKTR